MDDCVQITVLADNVVTRPGLAAGHGLAMLVEAHGVRVLFDTGPQGCLVPNASALGVSLEGLDAIVLSHGHYDHTGGLEAVLEVSGPVRVVAHAGIFDRTFSGSSPGELRYIGMPLGRDEYEGLGARFELAELPVELGGGLLTTGRIPPLPPDWGRRAGLWRNRGQAPHPDDFRDDCSLVARLKGCTAVVTGCAHAGLVNILRKARMIVPQGQPRVLVGGLHLVKASEEEVGEVARGVAQEGVAIVLPCHCTGEGATGVLQAVFTGQVMPVGAGSVIRIHEHGDTEVRHSAVPDPTDDNHTGKE